MRIRHVPRERDDEVLDWIALRLSGVSANEIARRYGRKSAVVVQTINLVRDDDIAASPGENAERSYW